MNYKVFSIVFLTIKLINGFIIKVLQVEAQNKTVTIIPDGIKLSKCLAGCSLTFG